MTDHEGYFAGVVGTIYLIHFDRPFRHAQHYTGWTSDLDKRIDKHRRGQGARLLAAVRKEGIEWHVVRTWTGDRHRERAIKKQGGGGRKCPACRPLIAKKLSGGQEGETNV